MQTIAHNPTATVTFVLLYGIAGLTAVYILIKGRHKFPERLYWAGWVLQVPLVGALAYWLYFFAHRNKC